jgi:Protein of Unknown function (DUF2784)
MILAIANLYSLLADLVLLIHLAFVAFVLLGFVVIWVGYFCGWSFVSNVAFRVAHLLAMAFVLAESLLGVMCPLTTWENQLRVRAGEARYEGSFVQEWAGRILFYECNEKIFTWLYAGFFAFVLLTFWIVPPRRGHGGTS